MDIASIIPKDRHRLLQALRQWRSLPQVEDYERARPHSYRNRERLELKLLHGQGELTHNDTFILGNALAISIEYDAEFFSFIDAYMPSERMTGQ